MNMFRKAICYASLCLTLIGVSGHAHEEVCSGDRHENNDREELLEEILAPHYNGLTEHLSDQESSYASKKNCATASQSVVQAHTVRYGTYDGATTHLAYYSDSVIVTFISDPSGRFSSGTQVIMIGNNPVSMTSSWTTEIVGGMTYTKHIHKGFFVYSTDFSQFVVFG